MSKKISLFSILLAILLTNTALFAQETPLFTIPDTVCAGHEIVPENILDGAQNYSWTFCPPQLHYPPQGEAFPASDIFINTANALSVVQAAESNYTGFAVNDNGTLTRLGFPLGMTGPAYGYLMGDMDGNMPTAPKGVQAVYDGTTWHVFVIGGTNLDNTSLMRMDFGNGLMVAPTNVINLGNTDGLLEAPSQLYIAFDGNNWYGFTFNNGTDLVRLNFGADLTALPTATFIGNIGGVFQAASGITAIEEDGNWYLFVTDRFVNSLIRCELGANLNNDAPLAVSMGSFNNRIIMPTGIAITKGCDEYYGYVLNNGGSGITMVHWSGSISTTPTYAILFGNVATMVQPLALTQFVAENGGLYLYAANNDNSLSKIFYQPCDNSNIAASSDRIPAPFKYDTAGSYTVYLTVDEGLPTVKTGCKTIYVEEAPPMTSKEDTLICLGDTVTLFALSVSDSFKWSPDFNIDTTGGKVVKVWPDYSTEYLVTIYYRPNCIIKEPINVDVSKITADAGPDRIMSDGGTTMLGGPGTSIGTQYTYNWWPDSFIVNYVDSPYALARPEYDITYYLEVFNTDGCYKIDSVLVSVPCDDIHLPNAFTPQSPNPSIATFGLLNLQMVKMNYFKIYDRWGKEVFSTEDVHGRWDGTYQGKDVPMGVYMWEVDAFCNLTGQRYKRSGTVTLLR